LAFLLRGQDKKTLDEMNEAAKNSSVKIMEEELLQNGYFPESKDKSSQNRCYSKKGVLLKDVCTLLKFKPEELMEVETGPSSGIISDDVIGEKHFYILKYNYSCSVIFPRWDKKIQREKQIDMESKVDVSMLLNPVFMPSPPHKRKLSWQHNAEDNKKEVENRAQSPVADKK